MIIQAPYPNIQATIVLPDPEFGDKVTELTTQNRRKTMAGSIYTYLRVTAAETFSFAFVTTRMKSLEFMDFFNEFNGQQWRIINYDGHKITGYCMSNPIELTPLSRANYAAGTTQYSAEQVSFNFEFEGIRI